MEDEQSNLAQRMEQVERQLELLQTRLVALDAVDSTFKAPFVVIDDNGNKILEIAKRPNDISLRLFNSKGKLSVSIGADGTRCGYLAVRNAEERLVGYLSVENYGGRLIIQDNSEDGGVFLHGGEHNYHGGRIVLGSIGGMNSSSLEIWSTPNGGGIELSKAAGEQIAVWPVPEDHQKAGSEQPEESRRPSGLAEGEFVVPDDFDDPLPDDLQRLFDGEDE